MTSQVECLQQFCLLLPKMKGLVVSVKVLAWFLTIAAVFGTIFQTWFFVMSVSNLGTVDCNEDTSTYMNGDIDDTYGIRCSAIGRLLKYSAFLSRSVFPAINPMLIQNAAQSTHQFTNEWSPAILVMLLPSLSLLRGSHTSNHSNCQFWYFTQVSALLISCVKVFIITVLGLWDSSTNLALIGILLGLAQLWLVQSFMETIRLQGRCITEKVNSFKIRVFASDYQKENIYCQKDVENNLISNIV